MNAKAEIGVFGGSGFYSLLENVRTAKIDTPYGSPSGPVVLAEVSGRSVAFLARHGADHSLPPHKVNYRANVWAFHRLGVQVVISPCAVGSLRRDVHPGDFVVCDQFVDRTKHRADTFYDGPITTHVGAADVYHPDLRRLAVESVRANGVPVHDGGTIVVIEGPRFASRAESQWYHDSGFTVIGMTQYPEAYLCHELGMGVVNISLVTDYDNGVANGAEPVNAASVMEVFRTNSVRIKQVVLDLVSRLPADLEPLRSTGALSYSRADVHVASDLDGRLFE